ncbi:hypothetical protein JC862_14220 [Morganella morganii]|uniref:hypothetical protein n=1 Tax=Morganella morganii TaxID=582 RepID=UPI001C4903CE|nr:hypothetical protein [Morganella morganii]QXO41880.1 hypothetical protein CXB74_014930 [Morganella morganii]QXO45489.1 hypothetical protein JC862_14220 [Morganella morganii]QXO49171.1 hypothetical protein JC861_15200 [Morganella morganii]
MKTLINFYKLVTLSAFGAFFSPLLSISGETGELTALFIFSINNTSPRINLVFRATEFTEKVITMSFTFRLNSLLIIALTARGGLMAGSSS